MTDPRWHTYLVTDSSLCRSRGRSVVETVRLAVRGGVSAVQVREPAAGTRELCGLSVAVLGVLEGTGVPLIVNDRVDIALAVGADGVHVGQDDLPPQAVRRIAGRELLVGLSVHTVEQVSRAVTLPSGTLDYVGVGPVFATSTKPDAAPPLGVDGLRAVVAAAAGMPCIAIGGIHEPAVAAVRQTGVQGVAVVSAVCAAVEPLGAAAALRGSA
ncbi:MAG: thiamine phosphate synthase [Nocardioidaceae bacterium]